MCAVTFEPNGHHMAAAGLGGQLCIWTLGTGPDFLTLELQVSKAYSGSQGRHLVTHT